MPTNLDGAASVIKTLPKNDVYILDQTNDELIEYPSVHQNFIKDMYQGLWLGKEKLSKYNKLILIFPGFKEPLGMIKGFENFCNDYSFAYEIITLFEQRIIHKGEVFIIPSDRDLVKVLEQSKIQNLKIVSDFGIISYNDTPLKKVVENGITTISTNFSNMGTQLANMVLQNEKIQIENESNLILRNSF
ncbi:MAG: substrate-binding domain-containing protein [Flavobacterium sp. JAD_PAG50586_2]|nr:MAG: substrate-binding domain-containing protein [Flavobacterium sp. JAD_PAG50586_2]